MNTLRTRAASDGERKLKTLLDHVLARLRFLELRVAALESGDTTAGIQYNGVVIEYNGVGILYNGT